MVRIADLSFLNNQLKKQITVLQELAMPDFSTPEIPDEFCQRTGKYRQLAA